MPALRADVVVSAPDSTLCSGTCVVPISVSGVSNLYSFQFDYSFDSGEVVSQPFEGTFLSAVGPTGFKSGSVEPGYIETVMGTGDTLEGPIGGASGSGDLENLFFRQVGPGSGPLAVSNIVLRDSTGALIPGTTGFEVEIEDAGTLPEPAFFVPLIGCCLGLVAFRIQRGRANVQ